MSEQDLNTEREALLALGAASVQTPNLPMGAYLLEASQIVVYLDGNDAARVALLDAGMEVSAGGLTEANLLPTFKTRLGAARHSQALWDAVRSPRKPDEARALEAESYQLREDLVSACRWNLRRDRVAQGTLNAIQEGVGIADLITDLDALAVIIIDNQEVFARDGHFDAEGESLKAQKKAQALRATQVGFVNNNVRRDAVDQRNRAWTHLHELVREIREAARYVFRKDQGTLKRFQSSYNRRRDLRRSFGSESTL